MKMRTVAFITAFIMSILFLAGWLHFASAAKLVTDVPVISSLEPDAAPNDLDIAIRISGTGFTAILSGSEVITPPVIWLGDSELVEMGWLSNTLMTATVPWGLDAGAYTITIINPDGISGSLVSAFTVTQGIDVWNSGELYGGWVEQVIVDPFDPQTIYVTAGEVGFFRSQDSGQNWSILRPGVGTLSLNASPVLPGRLYMMSTWELRRSDDGGENWQVITPQFPITDTAGEDCSGYLPVAHTTLTNTVYTSLCTSETPGPNGILRSDDGGLTWSEKMGGLTDTQVTAFAFHPTDPLTMYLGTASGRIYISSNGGESWQYASRPLGYIQSIAVDPFGEHNVWVNSIHGRDTPCETYYSNNSSLTSWTKVNPSNFEHFCRKVIFDPVNEGTIYVPFGSGFKSTNGGADWTEFNLGGDNYPIDIAVDPINPNTLYMTDGARGIYKSLDGGLNWQESNIGLAAMIPDLLETLPGEPGTVFTVVSNRIYKGTHGGAAWQKISPQWMSAVWDLQADPFSSSRLYAGSLAGMCISEDAGETFTDCVQLEPPPEYSGHSIWPQTLTTDPSQPGSLMVGVRFISETHFLDEGALYRTSDFGASWQIITPTIGISLPTEIVHDPLTPTIVYLVTSAGILRSLDSGSSWEPITEGIPELQHGGTLGIEPVPPGRILTMGSDMGLWISDDHGETWQNLPSTGLGINAAAFLWLPGETPVLYGATPTGLSRSIDRGVTWVRVPGALGYANVTALVAVQVDERTILYAGTTGGSSGAGRSLLGKEMIGAGVYRLTYTTLKESYTIFIPMAVK